MTLIDSLRIEVKADGVKETAAEFRKLNNSIGAAAKKIETIVGSGSKVDAALLDVAISLNKLNPILSRLGNQAGEAFSQLTAPTKTLTASLKELGGAFTALNPKIQAFSSVLDVDTKVEAFEKSLRELLGPVDILLPSMTDLSDRVTQFANDMRVANTQTRQITQALNRFDTKTKGAAAASRMLTQAKKEENEAFRKSIGALTERMPQAFQNLTRDVGNFGGMLGFQTGKLGNLGKVAGFAAGGIGVLISATQVVTGVFGAFFNAIGKLVQVGFNALKGAINAAVGAMGRMIDVMAGVVKGTLAVGAAMGAGALAALNVGRQAEVEFARVAKTLDGTGAQINDLRNQLLDFATDDPILSRIGNSRETLMSIAEIAGQMGLAAGDIGKFTRAMAFLVNATDLTAEKGSLMLAQFINVTKLPTAQIDNLASAMVALGNSTATTESRIAKFMQRTAITSRFGLSDADIAAFGATMGETGITPELGGTNFVKLLTQMNLGVEMFNGEVIASAEYVELLNEQMQVLQVDAENGVDGAAEAMADLQSFINDIASGTGVAARETSAYLTAMARVTNMTMSQFADAWENDAAQALTSFLREFGALNAVLQQEVLEDFGISGNLEAQRVLKTLAESAADLSVNLGTARGAFDANTAAQAEAERMANTLQGSLNELRNVFSGLLMDLGTVLMPFARGFIDDVLTPMVRAAGDATQKIREAFERLTGVGQNEQGQFLPTVVTIPVETRVEITGDILPGMTATQAADVFGVEVDTLLAGLNETLAREFSTVNIPIGEFTISVPQTTREQREGDMPPEFWETAIPAPPPLAIGEALKQSLMESLDGEAQSIAGIFIGLFEEAFTLITFAADWANTHIITPIKNEISTALDNLAAADSAFEYGQSIGTFAASIVDIFVTEFKNLFSNAKAIDTGTADDFINGILSGISKQIKGAFDAKGLISGYNELKEFGSNILNAMFAGIQIGADFVSSSLISPISDALGQFIQEVNEDKGSEAFSNLVGNLGIIIADAFDAILASDQFDAIVKFFVNLADQLLANEDLVTAFETLGQSIGANILTGMATALDNASGGLFSGIRDLSVDVAQHPAVVGGQMTLENAFSELFGGGETQMYSSPIGPQPQVRLVPPRPTGGEGSLSHWTEGLIEPLVQGVYARGGPVWQDGLYMLHAGEHVLTRNETSQRNRGGGGVTINLTAYGTSPRELADMIRRELRRAGE